MVPWRSGAVRGVPAFSQDIVGAAEARLDFVAQQKRPVLSAILRFGFVPPNGDQLIAWLAFDRFEIVFLLE